MKMKNAFILFIFFLTCQTLLAQKSEVLNNDNIVAMHLAKVSGNLIIQKINSSTTRFDMSTPGLLGLKSVKIPESIMEVMLSATKPAEVLQNEQVIQLNQAGFSKRFIIQKIQAGTNRFNVTTDGLIQLRIAKIPEAVTKVMINGNARTK